MSIYSSAIKNPIVISTVKFSLYLVGTKNDKHDTRVACTRKCKTRVRAACSGARKSARDLSPCRDKHLTFPGIFVIERSSWLRIASPPLPWDVSSEPFPPWPAISCSDPKRLSDRHHLPFDARWIGTFGLHPLVTYARRAWRYLHALAAFNQVYTYTRTHGRARVT